MTGKICEIKEEGKYSAYPRTAIGISEPVVGATLVVALIRAGTRPAPTFRSGSGRQGIFLLFIPFLSRFLGTLNSYRKRKSHFNVDPLRVFLSGISLMAVLITCSTVNAAITAPSYTAVFVADPTRPIPTQEFDCSQNIYAYFTWWGLKDLHQITVLWINPKGKQQDEIDLKFVASAEKIENWVGLKFLNLRKERNPLMHDSSSADFVGTWTARIFLDGTLLEEKKFAVTCD